MNKYILPAVLASFVAVAALLLSFPSQVNVETIVGYAAVLTLLGLVGLEYRINWKGLFGRN